MYFQRYKKQLQIYYGKISYRHFFPFAKKTYHTDTFSKCHKKKEPTGVIKSGYLNVDTDVTECASKSYLVNCREL